MLIILIGNEIKKNAVGPERFIAKMHLNTWYGIFGRRKDLIQTINIKRKDLANYMSNRIIKSIININDKICAILIHNNLNLNIIKNLNIYNPELILNLITIFQKLNVM